MSGTYWRSLAAMELLATNKHHSVPAIGPAWMPWRIAAGSRGAIACSRALDSWVSSLSRAKEGEAWLASWMLRVLAEGFTSKLME